MRPGRTVQAEVDSLGRVTRFSYRLGGLEDDRSADELKPLKRIQVLRSDEKFRALEEEIPLERSVEVRSVEIRSSLFAATDAAGSRTRSPCSSRDIFGGDVDFHRDLRKGDRFASSTKRSIARASFESRTGRVLATEFVNQARPTRPCWFQDPDGEGGYLRTGRQDLRSVPALVRWSSRASPPASPMRLHPILRPGAPTRASTSPRRSARGCAPPPTAWSSPSGRSAAMATWSSCATRASTRRSTATSRLRRGARQVGKRVAQGEVIGFVGHDRLGDRTAPALRDSASPASSQIPLTRRDARRRAPVAAAAPAPRFDAARCARRAQRLALLRGLPVASIRIVLSHRPMELYVGLMSGTSLDGIDGALVRLRAGAPAHSWPRITRPIALGAARGLLALQARPTVELASALPRRLPLADPVRRRRRVLAGAARRPRDDVQRHRLPRPDRAPPPRRRIHAAVRRWRTARRARGHARSSATSAAPTSPRAARAPRWYPHSIARSSREPDARARDRERRRHRQRQPAAPASGASRDSTTGPATLCSTAGAGPIARSPLTTADAGPRAASRSPLCSGASWRPLLRPRPAQEHRARSRSMLAWLDSRARRPASPRRTFRPRCSNSPP